MPSSTLNVIYGNVSASRIRNRAGRPLETVCYTKLSKPCTV